MNATSLQRRLLIAAMIVTMPGQGNANDSSSLLAAGGLVLTKTDAISIQREDLSIAPAQIRVRYEMRNDRGTPVTLHVAFPSPELPVETPAGMDITDANGNTIAHMINLPSLQRPNFLNFTVSADGSLLQPALEIRAIAPGGRNIAEQLRAIGGWSLVLNPRMFVNEPSPDEQAQGDIGPEILQKLRDLGAVEGTDDTYRPTWKTYVTFHWQQTLRPGLTIIEHAYQPVIGEFLFHCNNGKWIGGAVGDPTDMNEADCIEETMDHAMQILASQDSYGYLSALSLAYVLTTGANWAGPIGIFHLTIDGQNPASRDRPALMSLCSDVPLQRTAPLHLEGTVQNYIPKHDLRLLMVLNPPQK
jgi:hypothetical protein